MPAKAKLYSTESAFDSAASALESHFSLDAGQWCPKEQVKTGGDEDKYILPLPDRGSFKANHLLSGVVDYDGSWIYEEED